MKTVIEPMASDGLRTIAIAYKNYVGTGASFLHSFHHIIVFFFPFAQISLFCARKWPVCPSNLIAVSTGVYYLPKEG